MLCYEFGLGEHLRAARKHGGLDMTISEPLVLAGKIVLTAATAYEAQSIRIADGAQIVVAEHDLRINATDRLTIEGTASIVSFVDSEFQATGRPGRSAGDIAIMAGEVIGGLLGMG
jgi:hypothetical protein